MSEFEDVSGRIQSFIDTTLNPLMSYPAVNIQIKMIIDDLLYVDEVLKNLSPTKTSLDEVMWKIGSCIRRIQSGSFISHTAAYTQVHPLEIYLHALREAINRRMRLSIGEGANVVKIIWHGHACFEIRGNVTIITDPFKGIGLPEPATKADIVLCSHSHQDHNNASSVKKTGSVVLEGFIGTKKIGNVEIKGIDSYHDEENGSRRGRNSVYVFNVDDVRFCHLGDLGHDLSDEEVEELGEIDVLFVPIGGVFTIGPRVAHRVAQKLGPKMIIPMHYRISGMSANFESLNTIDDFIKGKSHVLMAEGPLFNIEKDDEGFYIYPPASTILVLSLNF